MSKDKIWNVSLAVLCAATLLAVAFYSTQRNRGDLDRRMGFTAYRRGDWPKAAQLLIRALELGIEEDQVAPTYTALGDCLLRLRKNAHALSFLQKAVCADRTSAEAYRMLAVAYGRVGYGKEEVDRCRRRADELEATRPSPAAGVAPPEEAPSRVTSP